MRALPSRRGLLERLLRHEGRRAEHGRRVPVTPDILAVERQEVGEVAVESGQDLDRGQTAGLEQPAQDHEGPTGVTAVDGVGQFVAWDVPRLTEVRQEVLGGNPGPGAVRRAQGAEQALDPAEVLSDVVGQQVGSGRLELDGRATEVLVEPRLALPRLGRGDVDHPTRTR